MATLSELLSQVGEIKKKEMASDPFFSVGQSLIGGQLQPSYGYNARDYIGANLAKNLLGGVFQGIAESNATDLSKGINELLPAVLTGKAVAKPDYLSNSQYESALANLAGIKNARDIAQLDEQTDLGNKLAFEIAKTRGVKGAEQDAQLEFLKKILGGSSLAADESTPTVQQGESQGSPIAPISGDMNRLALAAGAVPQLKPMLEQAQFEKNAKREDISLNKSVADTFLNQNLQALDIRREGETKYALDSLLNAYKQGVENGFSNLTDKVIARNLARLFSYESVVTETEYQSYLENNTSLPKEYIQAAKAAAFGTGTLPPEVRDSFIKIAANARNNAVDMFNMKIDASKKQAQAVKPDIIPEVFDARKVPKFDINSYMSQIKGLDYAKQLKNSGLTREQAFNQLMGIK